MPMFVLAQTGGNTGGSTGGNTGGPTGGNTGGGSDTTTISFPSPIGCADLLCVVQRVISLLYWVAIPVAVIMILYGGFKIMLAGGDPKKFSDGKKIILYAVIGLAIVLVSGGVVAIVKSVLGVTDQPQGPCPEGTEWTQINGSWDCS